MKQMYSDLFKELVKANYQGKLKEKVEELFSKDDINKEEFAGVISSLCGIKLKYDDDYIQNLESAINEYSMRDKTDNLSKTNDDQGNQKEISFADKIVNKIKVCSMDCADENTETLCQKSCPFNAIMIDKTRKSTYINSDKCTDCGFCVEACPTGSILDTVQYMPLANLLKSDKMVIAQVAPAITGQFGEDVSIHQLRAAFKKIGFAEMVETAFFADMLTLNEAIEFNEHVQTKDDLMITSCCCPMWVGMLKKVYEDLVKYVSPSVSPMIAAGRVLKKLNPDCKVVFIGPCVAKKAEAKDKQLAGAVDYVLTFAELKDIFDSLEINPSELEEDISTEYASREGRLYARTGGVSISIYETLKEMFPEKAEIFKAIQANGIRECKDILNKAENKNIDANFIEGMGCVGGCVGGPKALIPKEEGRQRVNDFADNSEIRISLYNTCMKEVLHKIGIDKTEDFANEEKAAIFKRSFND